MCCDEKVMSVVEAIMTTLKAYGHQNRELFDNHSQNGKREGNEERIV